MPCGLPTAVMVNAIDTGGRAIAVADAAATYAEAFAAAGGWTLEVGDLRVPG